MRRGPHPRSLSQTRPGQKVVRWFHVSPWSFYFLFLLYLKSVSKINLNEKLHKKSSSEELCDSCVPRKPSSVGSGSWGLLGASQEVLRRLLCGTCCVRSCQCPVRGRVFGTDAARNDSLYAALPPLRRWLSFYCHFRGQLEMSFIFVASSASPGR